MHIKFLMTNKYMYIIIIVQIVQKRVKRVLLYQIFFFYQIIISNKTLHQNKHLIFFRIKSILFYNLYDTSACNTDKMFRNGKLTIMKSS